jgi:hypothetical protein
VVGGGGSILGDTKAFDTILATRTVLRTCRSTFRSYLYMIVDSVFKPCTSTVLCTSLLLGLASA